MEDNHLSNAYSRYIFQMGDVEAFQNWKTKNKAEYDKYNSNAKPSEIHPLSYFIF